MNTAPELITRAIPSPFMEETPIEKETPAENSWNSDPPGAAPITKESKPMKTINPGTRTYGVSRRHFVTTAGFAIAALCITPRRLVAEDVSPVIVIREAAATAKITITKLRGGVSVLEGSGGNIAVLTGRDGKVLVEAGITASRKNITEALASISSDPIRHLINSHWHFDHTDGNEWLHSEGAEITAHENTRKRLSVDTRVEGWKFTFPASPAGALPTRLFTDEQKMYLNGTAVRLKYYGPAHTDSDISVEFEDADILHVADTFWNGHYPFIDYSTGGSIDGSIRAAEANVARVTDETIVIPGHGPVGNKAQLTDFRDMLVGIREKVSALKRQGRSLAETITAKPTAEWDEKWGGWVIDGRIFTTLVYLGV